jgi:hypothetical protein
MSPICVHLVNIKQEMNSNWKSTLWRCCVGKPMLLSPWETNCCSASQEIILYNPKIHYHVHKSLLLDPILSQTNAVHISTSYFLNISLQISCQKLCMYLSSLNTCYISRPSRVPSYHVVKTQITKLLSKLVFASLLLSKRSRYSDWLRAGRLRGRSSSPDGKNFHFSM